MQKNSKREDKRRYATGLERTQSAADVNRSGGRVAIDEEYLKWLRELLRDAESCHRLTQWEEDFLEDSRSRVEQYGLATNLSDRQEEVLRRIEEKVYA